MHSIKFQLNQPQILALKHHFGVNVQGRFGLQVQFQLEDNRTMYLKPEVADKLTALELQPGETFGIAKRREHRSVVWDVWLTPETEQKRAAREIQLSTGADLTPLLVRSIEEASSRKNAVALAIPEALLAPTGTEGPLPAPRPAVTATASGMRKSRQPIPADVAFREIVGFVTAGLADAGEQWTAEARQDAVSTVFIAFAKRGLIDLWRREAA